MKNKRTRLFAVLLSAALGLAMVAGLAACSGKAGSKGSGDSSLKDVQKSGQLILGCDDAFPPMGFDDNGTIKGFDIDLAKAVAAKLGVKLVVTPINWSNKELELNNRKIDVIWNGYSINAARNKQVEFTKPYLQNTQRLAVKAKSDIKTKADLKGKTVGVQIDSAAEEVINADTAFVKSLKQPLRVYDTYQEAMLDLKDSNRVDAIGGDQVLLDYIMTQDPGSFRVLDDVLDSEYYGIGCRKGSVALRKAIDNALDELKADGTAAKISDKWFGADLVLRDVPKLTQADLEGSKG